MERKVQFEFNERRISDTQEAFDIGLTSAAAAPVGSVVYVSGTGSDAAAGDINNPVRTLYEARDRVEANIVVLDGVHGVYGSFDLKGKKLFFYPGASIQMITQQSGATSQAKRILVADDGYYFVNSITAGGNAVIEGPGRGEINQTTLLPEPLPTKATLSVPSGGTVFNPILDYRMAKWGVNFTFYIEMYDGTDAILAIYDVHTATKLYEIKRPSAFGDNGKAIACVHTGTSDGTTEKPIYVYYTDIGGPQIQEELVLHTVATLGPVDIQGGGQPVTIAPGFINHSGEAAADLSNFGYVVGGAAPNQPVIKSTWHQFVPQLFRDGETLWIDAASKQAFTYSQIVAVIQETNNTYVTGTTFNQGIWTLYPPRIDTSFYGEGGAILGPGRVGYLTIFNGWRWNNIAPDSSGPSALVPAQEPGGPAVSPTNLFTSNEETYSADEFELAPLFVGGDLENLEATIAPPENPPATNIFNCMAFDGTVKNCEITGQITEAQHALYDVQLDKSFVLSAGQGIKVAAATGSKTEAENSIFIACGDAVTDGELQQCVVFKCMRAHRGSLNRFIRNSIVSECSGQYISQLNQTVENSIIHEALNQNLLIPGSVEVGVVFKGNPFFKSNTQPYDLRVQAVVKGNALDSPALGISSNASAFGGQRDAGAYDEKGELLTQRERFEISAPWAKRDRLERRSKNNVTESGIYTILPTSGTYMSVVFTWELSITDADRQKLNRMIQADDLRIWLYPRPIEDPTLVLAGYIETRADVSNVRGFVDLPGNRVGIRARFQAPDPTQNIEDYL